MYRFVDEGEPRPSVCTVLFWGLELSYKALHKYITRHKCCPAEFAAVRNGLDRLCEKASTSPKTWGELPGMVLQAMTTQRALWRAGSEPKIPNTAPELSAAPLAVSS